MTNVPAAFPPRLQGPGSDTAAFRSMLDLVELPLGAMRRVTWGELDLLLR